ncbi:Protein C15C7.7 [Aphelenchoides avenae]|nr:Protein C15C7.7 [Aphelenchus avenae]
MVPFDSLFDVATAAQYHRVITMEKFMKSIAYKLWPKENRKVLCWGPRESVYDKTAEKGCHAKEGNPFGPFWDHSSVDFVGELYYGSLRTGYDVTTSEGVEAWTKRFPASKHPVLAFSGAPAAFPVDQANRFVQKYLRWKTTITDKAARFIKKYLTRRTTSARMLPAISSCLLLLSAWATETSIGDVTREICKPSAEIVLDEVESKVHTYNAQSVFVASDKDHMIDELSERLKPYNVTVHKLEPDNPYVSLAVLAKSDHFIGNCVSTFSAFVTRQREFQERFYKSTSFFGFSPKRAKIEL